MDEENEKISVKDVSVKWGLILGIISIVLFLTIYFSGLLGESWPSWIGAVISAGIIYMAHKEYKELGDGYMSYGKGLGVGTLTSVISSAVSSIFTYVYVKFINTDYATELLDITRYKMEDEGQSEDQIEMAMGMVEKFMTAEAMLAMGLIAGIFFGFIISLIVSAITKNNDPSLEV